MASVVEKVYALLSDAWSSARAVAVGFVDGDGAWSPTSATNPMPAAGDATVVVITPTVSTSAYVDGDIFFDLTEVANAVLAAGDTCYVQSVTVVDKDAEGLAIDLYVAQGSSSLGSVSSASSISDANIVANRMQRLCQIVASDYTTLNGSKIATAKNLAFPVKTSGSTSFWLGAIARSGATLTATDDIVVLVGIARK